VRGDVVFSGYTQTGGEMKFALTDPAAQTTSEWLGVGGTFAGYTVKAFDPKTETLAVEKSGATTQLALKSSAVRPAPPAMIRVSPRVAVGSNYPADKLADLQAREKVAQELLAQRHRTLQRLADLKAFEALKAQDEALRQRFPDDHPERAEVRRKLAELEPRLAQARQAQMRDARASALRQIQDPASTPAQVEEARRNLATAEAALAREGAAP
jgi:hypothetical protein